MTRYSRGKIDEILAEANGHMNYVEYENIISQLLEENRILREGLEWYSACSDGCTCGDGWGHDAAHEALTKAGEVYKNE